MPRSFKDDDNSMKRKEKRVEACRWPQMKVECGEEDGDSLINFLIFVLFYSFINIFKTEI